jgi:ribose 5-phosphate isomerase
MLIKDLDGADTVDVKTIGLKPCGSAHLRLLKMKLASSLKYFIRIFITNF